VRQWQKIQKMSHAKSAHGLMVSIHDPVHGTIDLSGSEIKLVDSQPFQRLRHIKQLGFSELAFPGATHSRYSHSLGAMHVATCMIDRILPSLQLPQAEAQRIRQTVRLAVLFHDLGHAPMSHVSERVMPQVSQLGLQHWVGEKKRQATHEDYTVKLLIDSELTGLLDTHLKDGGVTGTRLAALIMGRTPPGEPDAFVVGRVNLLPLLHQLVSGEMDADRMDYLRRDAYYCGVSYGHFDHVWLTRNVTAVEYDGQLGLALQHKGVWAFENFLLARYHMFLSVYYHHTAICFDHLLGFFYDSGEYILPATTAEYLKTDDVHLMTALRSSKNLWAQAVVRRRAYRLLVETHDDGDLQDTDAGLDKRLEAEEISFFRVRKRAILSKYFSKGKSSVPLLVVEPERGRVTRIEDYTPLYRRFDEEIGVSRIYCKPEHLKRARKLL